MDHESSGNSCIKPEQVLEKDARLRILHLLQLLQNESDVDHPLTTKQITERMEELHGLHMHRTTVPSDLSALAAAGYDIQSVRGRVWHFHYEDRTFSLAELKLLIDAVQASKFITRGKSAELIRKISSLTSKNNAEGLRRSVQIAGRAKTDNEKGYYIVDTVNRAMNMGKKISFAYFMYDTQKKQRLKNNGNPYTVSPYDLVWDGDCYYLIGYCDERFGIRVFRADRIASAPDILSDAATKRPEDYSSERYTTESFRMFATEEPVDVTLRCQEKIMNSFLDQFGLNTPTVPLDDESFLATVRICVSPLFFRWVFGSSGAVQIIAPEKVKNEYWQMLRNAMKSIEDSK